MELISPMTPSLDMLITDARSVECFHADSEAEHDVDLMLVSHLVSSVCVLLSEQVFAQVSQSQCEHSSSEQH